MIEPFYDMEKEKRDLRSTLDQRAKESLASIKRILSEEKEGSFLFPLLIELIGRVEGSLEFIKKLSQLARGKFSDKIFGEHFNQVVAEEIEKIDSLLDNVLNYIKVNFTVQKVDTIHVLIEEAIKKNQSRLAGKKVHVLKKFEKGLPETIVPDEHLRYMLCSILQYALVLVPEDGSVGFATRSFTPQKEIAEGLGSLQRDGKYIEISVLFNGYKKTKERMGAIFQMPFSQEEEGLDFELRLVDEIARRHQGMMKFEPDVQKGRTLLSLILPMERRKVVYYQSVG